MDPVTRTERHDRSPAPLIAAAAALAGIAAARTPVGKLALLAAAGTAAYRWLHRRPATPPPDTEADWCRIRSADEPEFTEWAEEDAPVMLEEAPAFVAEAAHEAPATVVHEAQPELAMPEAPPALILEEPVISEEPAVALTETPATAVEPEPEAVTAAESSPQVQEDVPPLMLLAQLVASVAAPVPPLQAEPEPVAPPSAEEPQPGPAAEAEVPPPQAVAPLEVQHRPVTLAAAAEPETRKPISAPLLEADPLPTVTEISPSLPIHSLDAESENKWLLSVEPLPVLLEKEPRELHDELINSGLLGCSLEPLPEAPSLPLSYIPPLATGGDIPDAIEIHLEAPVAASALDLPEAPKSDSASGPLTSDRLAELLKALAGTRAAPSAQVSSTPLASVPESPATAPVWLPQETEVVASDSRPQSAPLSEPVPAPIVPALETQDADPEPVISAAALFANLAGNREPDAPSAPMPELPENVEVMPVTVAHTIRPKLRPRPIVTSAHPNNPARKNWLTWWK